MVSRENFTGLGKSHPGGSFLGNNDGEVRAKERTHAALLAFVHFRAFGREISPGVHLFRPLKNLGRTKLDADSTTLAISIFYEQRWHNFLSKTNGTQINADFQDIKKNRKQKPEFRSNDTENFSILDFSPDFVF
jgi:hypothetical protein